jgi:hypothetical protein
MSIRKTGQRCTKDTLRLVIRIYQVSVTVTVFQPSPGGK